MFFDQLFAGIKGIRKFHPNSTINNNKFEETNDNEIKSSKCKEIKQQQQDSCFDQKETDRLLENLQSPQLIPESDGWSESCDRYVSYSQIEQKQDNVAFLQTIMNDDGRLNRMSYLPKVLATKEKYCLQSTEEVQSRLFKINGNGNGKKNKNKKNVFRQKRKNLAKNKEDPAKVLRMITKKISKPQFTNESSSSNHQARISSELVKKIDQICFLLKQAE